MSVKSEKLTACNRCKHSQTATYPRITGGRIEHICKAPKAKPVFDAMTGRVTYAERALCSEINIDGHCPHYKEKQP